MGAYLECGGGGPKAVVLLACSSPLDSAVELEGLAPVHFQQGSQRASQGVGIDGGRRGRTRGMI